MKSILFKLIVILWVVSYQLPAQNIPLEWKVGMTDSKDTPPQKLFKAVVPGGVHPDYMKATKKDPYIFGENVKEYRFLEAKYWRYKTTFKRPDLQPDQSLVFSSEAVPRAPV